MNPQALLTQPFRSQNKIILSFGLPPPLQTLPLGTVKTRIFVFHKGGKIWLLSQQTSLCPRPLGLAMDVSWGSRFNPQPCQPTSNCRLLHHPLLQSYLSSRLNIAPVFSPLPFPSLYCLPELLIMVDFGSDFTTVVRFGSYANKPFGMEEFHKCSGYNPQPPSPHRQITSQI